MALHQALQQNAFFVKEHVGYFKAANEYDIYDPQTQQKVMECREPNLGMLTRLLRFTDYKRYTPFEHEIRASDGTLLVEVSRGITFIRSTVEVHGGDGALLGTYRQRIFSIGGAFDVLDTADRVVCNLQGKWTSWEFRFLSGQRELAKVTKKWAGIGKELFTTADNYMLTIDPSVAADSPIRPLVLGAVMCIDMVLKE